MSLILALLLGIQPPATQEGVVLSDVHRDDDGDGNYAIVLDGPPYWSAILLKDAEILIDGRKAKPVDIKKGMRVQWWENKKGQAYKVRASKRLIPRALTPDEVWEIKRRFGEPQGPFIP